MFAPALLISFLAFLANLAFATPTVQLVKKDDNLPARVPYVFPAPGADPVADSIRARHGTLLDLDGVLLNSDLFASGWNDLFGVIRDNNTIPPDFRELFILRSAALNSATYQWLQHEPVARSVGLTTAQLKEIRLTPAFGGPLVHKSTLSAGQSAAMLFADFVTKSVNVPQPIFDGLKKFLTNKQMVEAVATVGGYNFVSRFVVALNVDDKMNVPVPIPK